MEFIDGLFILSVISLTALLILQIYQLYNNTNSFCSGIQEKSGSWLKVKKRKAS